MSTISVACLQLEALGLSRAEESLERALSMIDRAGQNQPDLIVLPECTYPAYYLHSTESFFQAKLRPHQEVVRLFGERATSYGCHLVVGIAEPAKSGRLLNSAYLFNPQGEVVGTYAKSFLWHFDQYWFDPGQQFPAFDLPFGRTGLFVCADGRMPEVVRALGLERSRLLVDATAWTTTGGDRGTLTNPQFDYMMPVRAIENGAWIVVANKVGVEAESVVYCGRSCVVSPDGRHVAQASPDSEEILMAQIDLAEAVGPPVRRRPDCYATLTEATENLPVTRLLAESLVPAETIVRVGLLQLIPYDSAEAFLARVTTLIEILVRQEAKLLVLPGVPHHKTDSPAYRAEQTLGPLKDLSRRLGCGLVCPLISLSNNGQLSRAVYLIDRGQVLGVYHQTHLTDDEMGLFEAGDKLPVFETPYGRVGVMLNSEGLLPEVPRTLMLQGADLIIWPTHFLPYSLRTIGRTRADENKVFLALATPLEEDSLPQSSLINPAGGFLAVALPDIEQGIAGQMAWALTRYKEMAPNTHVVFNRQPDNYGQLVG